MSLERDCASLEARLATRGTEAAQLQNKLCMKQHKLREWAKIKACAHALASQRRLHDIGDKATTLLAWLERQDEGRNWVLEI
ncbi:hypothetical protein NDU88_004291 [Pleurodeles waltl]|uniref:Uncharacterized protein n=1 Tax=Pleurodeles waltl TaxID=8319 RepID=A0AAV7UFP3_PLEWA|nr:hypothetical protein NDU88_004291 [Pleurodeles waltl]